MKKIPDPNQMKKVQGPKLNKADHALSKIRITTYLDPNILDALRKLAMDSGSKYQAVLNQILNDYLFGQKEGLVARISRLEKAVFKARAA